MYIYREKICDKIEELEEIRMMWKNNGKVVVFTNGCFDIIHTGHVKLLSEAKKFGDVLIVGINSDHSVKSIKGPSRPIQSEKDRMIIMASLKPVDLVVVFNELTPVELIKLLKPDIHVKGGDYEAEKLPEYNTILEYGGVIRIVSLLEGYSTTMITQKIKD